MVARLVQRATSSARIVHGGTYTALSAVTRFGSAGGEGYVDLRDSGGSWRDAQLAASSGQLRCRLGRSPLGGNRHTRGNPASLQRKK
jgi:hypothetical protein